jgi:hypothetical protein
VQNISNTIDDTLWRKFTLKILNKFLFESLFLSFVSFRKYEIHFYNDYTEFVRPFLCYLSFFSGCTVFRTIYNVTEYHSSFAFKWYARLFMTKCETDTKIIFIEFRLFNRCDYLFLIILYGSVSLAISVSHFHHYLVSSLPTWSTILMVTFCQLSFNLFADSLQYESNTESVVK